MELYHQASRWMINLFPCGPLAFHASAILLSSPPGASDGSASEIDYHGYVHSEYPGGLHETIAQNNQKCHPQSANERPSNHVQFHSGRCDIPVLGEIHGSDR